MQPNINPAELAERIANLERAALAAAQSNVALNCRIRAAEARLALAEKGLKPRFPVQFRSQFGEDVLLYDLFAGQTSGFFIEAGAFDGRFYSVTYALESLGWTGLLVEPIPERAEQCRANRPASRVVHAALSHPSAPSTMEFTVVDDQYGGMLSYLTTDQQHHAAIAAANRKTRTVKVPVTSLDALLADHKGDVDAAVIDVEGGEIDVLRGFDLARHRPKVLLLEDNSRSDHSPLGRYMALQPYIFVCWLEVSRVYLRSDLADWRSRLTD